MVQAATAPSLVAAIHAARHAVAGVEVVVKVAVGDDFPRDGAHVVFRLHGGAGVKAIRDGAAGKTSNDAAIRLTAAMTVDRNGGGAEAPRP